MNDDKGARKTRWWPRLCITVACAAEFVLLFPATTCGCHFHAVAVPVMLAPIGWGVFALLTYSGRKEQIVGWVAFLLGLGAAWIGFEGNLVFLFMPRG